LTRLEPNSSLVVRVHTLMTPSLGLSLNDERSITAPSTVFCVFVVLFFLLGSSLRDVGGRASRVALGETSVRDRMIGVGIVLLWRERGWVPLGRIP